MNPRRDHVQEPQPRRRRVLAGSGLAVAVVIAAAAVAVLLPRMADQSVVSRAAPIATSYAATTPTAEPVLQYSGVYGHYKDDEPAEQPPTF